MTLPIEVSDIFQEAIRCRDCFESGVVEAAHIDLAQPRWIGPSYWGSNPRIVLTLINPGSGGNSPTNQHLVDRELLHDALNSSSPPYAYLRQQRQNLPNWGKGKFWAFFVEEVGLDPDAIGLANIAWCASRNNQYPKQMLLNCFNKFTKRLLITLYPDVLILSGKASQNFRDMVHQILPKTKIISTIHYSHRKGLAAQTEATNLLRKELFSGVA